MKKIVAILPFVFVSVACKHEAAGPVASSAPPLRRDDILAGTAPTLEARLIQAGLSIDVEVRSHRKGDTLSFDVCRSNEVIEHEAYLDQADRFSLSEAASEAFEPPLDLIRYPFISGHPWQWQGSMRSGAAILQARATVEATSKLSYVAGVQEPVIHVLVKLQPISEGGNKIPELPMEFEFVLKKGLQVREFGEASRREPRGTP